MTGGYQPQHPVLRWIEKRLPIGQLIYSEFVAYPTPRNLNYWWTFGAILSFMLGAPDRHRHRPCDALHAECRLGVQVNRDHHARRQLRLASALSPLHRRIDVLHRRLRPHVRSLYYGSYKEPCEWMDPGGRNYLLMVVDGLHGLRTGLGSNEFLGRDRDHQSVFGDSHCRRHHR